MSLACLTLALLCLAAAASAAPLETKADGCVALTLSRSQILGGKTVTQAMENIKTSSGCQWVLAGGSPSSYTLVDGCSRCRDTAGGTSCVGTSQMFHPGCAAVVGPDCRLHLVDPANHEAACRRLAPPPMLTLPPGLLKKLP